MVSMTTVRRTTNPKLLCTILTFVAFGIMLHGSDLTPSPGVIHFGGGVAIWDCISLREILRTPPYCPLYRWEIYVISEKIIGHLIISTYCKPPRYTTSYLTKLCERADRPRSNAPSLAPTSESQSNLRVINSTTLSVFLGLELLEVFVMHHVVFENTA